MKICILGAGFTGLAAAYRLLKNGHEVTIFEIGCEGGNLLNLLPLSKEVVGLDISKAALKDAKKLLGKKATLIQADAEKRINLPQGKFDVIICSQTLEHVKNPQK